MYEQKHKSYVKRFGDAILVVANYINIDMWLICVIFAISLLIFLSIVDLSYVY